jgi:hypothetical protein
LVLRNFAEEGSRTEGNGGHGDEGTGRGAEVAFVHRICCQAGI